MALWSAEFVVDKALARRLLRQFDELDARSLRPLSEGWDYAIWVVDEQWAFRFPRRASVVRGTLLEIAALPELAPLLPLPIPAPVFVGEPTDDFPWPFFGSRLLPGRELAELELDDEQRRQVGLQLAAFLRALHSAELAAELPADSNRRADMGERVPKTRDQLDELERLAIWERPPLVDAILVEAEALPPARTAAVVHGDLHFRQLLATDEGRLTGVLDWVDLCRSDPAIDLTMLWAYLPPNARGEFLDAYGPLDDSELLRARVVALSVWGALAHYGHVEGHTPIEREAVAGLGRIVS
ncbi:MAG TPA: phosphotransferase [Gaiellaceae bacterium]|nr:phosphotransferase [Gaiellaceae bacterium]